MQCNKRVLLVALLRRQRMIMCSSWCFQVAALEIYDNPPDQDNARKEVDNFPSNIYSKYDGLQHKVKSFFDVSP